MALNNFERGVAAFLKLEEELNWEGGNAWEELRRIIRAKFPGIPEGLETVISQIQNEFPDRYKSRDLRNYFERIFES